MKLDVDGIELNIIEGAKNCLKSVEKLMIEVDKHNEALIKEFLFDQGFKISCEYHSHSAKLSNRNILFCK